MDPIIDKDINNNEVDNSESNTLVNRGTQEKSDDSGEKTAENASKGSKRSPKSPISVYSSKDAQESALHGEQDGKMIFKLNLSNSPNQRARTEVFKERLAVHANSCIGDKRTDNLQIEDVHNENNYPSQLPMLSIKNNYHIGDIASDQGSRSPQQAQNESSFEARFINNSHQFNFDEIKEDDEKSDDSP